MAWIGAVGAALSGLAAWWALRKAGAAETTAAEANQIAREANELSRRSAEALESQAAIARTVAGPHLTIRARGSDTFRIWNTGPASARHFGFQIVVGDEHGPVFPDRISSIPPQTQIPEQGVPLELHVQPSAFDRPVTNGESGYLLCWYVDASGDRREVQSEPFRVRIVENQLLFEPT